MSKITVYPSTNSKFDLLRRWQQPFWFPELSLFLCPSQRTTWKTDNILGGLTLWTPPSPHCFQTPQVGMHQMKKIHVLFASDDPQSSTGRERSRKPTKIFSERVTVLPGQKKSFGTTTSMMMNGDPCYNFGKRLGRGKRGTKFTSCLDALCLQCEIFSGERKCERIKLLGSLLWINRLEIRGFLPCFEQDVASRDQNQLNFLRRQL